MKVKILAVFLSFLVIALPVKSFAIIPFLITGAIRLAPVAAEIAVGQFAAAGLARVINPTTSKTLEIPKGNRALKVSFGVASSLASLALFASSSGYLSSKSINCGVGSNPPVLPFDVASSQGDKHYLVDLNLVPVSGSWSGSVGRSVRYFTDPKLVGSSFRAFMNCYKNGTLQSASDVMWLDNSTNITQAKTDKLVTDLKAFAVSNPSDFAAIVQITDFPVTQDVSNVGGTVSVVSDGAGNTTVSGSGSSGASISLDQNGNILIDSAVSVANVGVGTGSGTGSGAGTGSGTGAGAGAGTGTGVDMSGVISAVNANSLSITSSVNSAASQATIDAKTIADKLDILNKKCVLNPTLVECKDLGTFNTASHNFGNGITSADTFSSIYTKHNASWTTSPIGSTITRLFPSTGVSGYPVWSINLSGTTLTLDMANYSTFFSMLGSLVLVLAGFQSIKIILGRD